MKRVIILINLFLISPVVIAETEYEKSVNSYVEYNCDYNAKALIKDGSKTKYKDLIVACKRGASDIKKFINDWPEFGTNEGIMSFQDTVSPYAHEQTAESSYKDQIYRYGVGSWGIGYIQNASAKANTIKQWKQGKFEIK